MCVCVCVCVCVTDILPTCFSKAISKEESRVSKTEKKSPS